MSTQKLKILKKIKGVDSYSKNPIIDSLIKQKLQSEIIIIKDSFNQLVKKDDFKSKQSDNQPKPILKRRLSSHNLGALTPQKIKSSINYYPINQFTIDFVNQRQKNSPLLQQSAVIELNKARNNSEDLFVKLKQSDKIMYESVPSQDPTNYYSQLENRLKKSIPSDIWLPEKPEVQQIIKNRAQVSAMSSKRQKSEIYQFVMTDRSFSQGFSPLKNSRELTHKKSSKAIIQPQINYEPKKYHKNDFISLQNWLQSSINALKNEQKKSQQDQQDLQKERLNKIFTIYMSSIKQLIRLTYIQSAEKGLLFQKIIWSLIRLFEYLINQQHSINYNDFKTFNKEIIEERQLFKSRMQKLENKLKQKQADFLKTNQQKNSIAYTALTFKKVNQEMNTEIGNLVQKISKIKKQNDYLMNNLIKIIKQFEERQIIKTQKSQEYITYYYLNSKNKIEVVAKVQRKDQLEQSFKKDRDKAQDEDTLIPKSVEKLENQLTNYWGKKRAYLDVDAIIKEHCYTQVKDAATQADGRGPYAYVDFATQHPSEGQQTFEQFLRKQLTQEREKWTKKQQEYKQTQISLKELYDQLKQTITNLTTQNLKLKTTIDQKDHQINIAERKNMQAQQKNGLLTKKIVQLEKEITEKNEKQMKYKAQIQEGITKMGEMKKKYMFQVENNKILASSNFKLTQKIQDLQKKFEDLEDRIKILAPHLQETMGLAVTSQNPILLTLNSLIEKYLSNYVQRDAKVFLTF